MRFPAVVLALFAAMTSPAWAISGGAAKVCDVRDFGARGDGLTLDTDSIQRAIDACAGSPGRSVVRLGDRGVFLSGPIQLKAHSRLDIESGSSLVAAREHAGGKRNSPTLILVTAMNVEDVAITGNGTIDASEHANSAEPNRAIDFIRVRHGRIAGVAIHGSKALLIASSRDIQVENIRIDSATPSDLGGLEVDGVEGATFKNVTTSVGAYGLVLGEPTTYFADDPVTNSDVKILDCTFVHGDGLRIAAARGVTAERLRFVGTSKGIYVTSVLTPVSELSFTGVHMTDVAEAIALNMDSAQPIANISIAELKATNVKSAGSMRGSSRTPITSVTMQNVSIEAETGLRVRDTQGSFRAVAVRAANGEGLLLAASAAVERE